MKNKLSTKFYFRNFDKEVHKIKIETLDDTVEHIKTNDERHNINFITNLDLTKILFQMIDCKYVQYPKFEWYTKQTFIQT